MATELEIALYTMCVVQAGNRVLLVNRPDQRGFPGYLGLGGKVDFPESLTESAVREVFEETGLRVKNLVYKGVTGSESVEGSEADSGGAAGLRTWFWSGGTVQRHSGGAGRAEPGVAIRAFQATEVDQAGTLFDGTVPCDPCARLRGRGGRCLDS